MSETEKDLLKQVDELTALVDEKDRRIHLLESQAVEFLGSGMDEMMKKIGNLEEQIFRLTSLNQNLRKELNAGKNLLERVSELEPLLEKEQKSRNFAERLARHMEAKCAQETEARLLTEELYNFQKEELRCAEKEIFELKDKLKLMSSGSSDYSDSPKRIDFPKEPEKNVDKLERLENELRQLQGMKGNVDDPEWSFELHRRLEEIEKLRNDLDDIFRLRKEINSLKVQIEAESKNKVST